MNLKVLICDTGIDENKDKHCDLDGWFLNDYEMHRARLLPCKGAREERPEWLAQDLHLERLSAEDFTGAFVKDSPYARSDWDPEKHSAIRAYSENSPDGYSCAAVNGFLRWGEVKEGLTAEGLRAFAAGMNLSISGFVFDKEITLYRGMRFKPGDPFLKTFDEALSRMEETRMPVPYIEKGFMSASRSVETARTYAYSENTDICHVYMSVTIEKGVAAMPLSLSKGTTTKKNDKEVLFQSGRPFYIIGMDIKPRGGGLYDYHVNLLATDRRI